MGDQTRPKPKVPGFANIFKQTRMVKNFLGFWRAKYAEGATFEPRRRAALSRQTSRQLQLSAAQTLHGGGRIVEFCRADHALGKIISSLYAHTEL